MLGRCARSDGGACSWVCGRASLRVSGLVESRARRRHHRGLPRGLVFATWRVRTLVLSDVLKLTGGFVVLREVGLSFLRCVTKKYLEAKMEPLLV